MARGIILRAIVCTIAFVVQTAARADIVQIPGEDVRAILGRVIPDIDYYFQTVIDHLDSITVDRSDGKMKVDVLLVQKKLVVPIRPKRQAKRGQPYEIRLKRKLHFEISMHKDWLFIEKISGIKLLVKLPIVPDGVYPRSLVFDSNTETLRINAGVVGGAVRLVVKIDVRSRRFKGIDWPSTIIKNLSLN